MQKVKVRDGTLSIKLESLISRQTLATSSSITSKTFLPLLHSDTLMHNRRALHVLLRLLKSYFVKSAIVQSLSSLSGQRSVDVSIACRSSPIYLGSRYTTTKTQPITQAIGSKLELPCRRTVLLLSLGFGGH